MTMMEGRLYNNMLTNYKGHHFVIDTSALLFDPGSLTYFKNSTVHLPVSVIQELDKHKDRLDHIGAIARSVNRKLYNFKKLGSLSTGVKCEATGVTIKVVQEVLSDVPSSLDKNLPDDRILSVCLTLSKNSTKKNKVHLITNDLNLSLKADAYNIDSFEFQPESKYLESTYTGFKDITWEDNSAEIQEFYETKKVVLPNNLEMESNEFLRVRDTKGNVIIKAVHCDGKLYPLDEKILKFYKIKPLNDEQLFAMQLLINPKVKIVTLTGGAGTGKTILSAAAGLYQSIEPEHRNYEKLILSRSLVVLSGKDKMGFLPGTIKEKLDPYLIPLRDAIDFILGDQSNALEYLTASATNPNFGGKGKPRVEIEPLQYIKGRTLRSSFFIVDEAQNLTINELKTIVSRIDSFSKIILLGDSDQIDNPYLNRTNNGLSQVIEKFKGSPLYGHITLQEGIRSDLATLAAKLL